MPQLHFQINGRPLFIHNLKPGRTVVGRSDACDLALPSDTVSRTHCVVERRPDGWWVTDRSRHGTQVNGQPIKRELLQDGDTIQFGTYVAKFQVESDQQLTKSLTATSPMPAAIYEELVEARDTQFAAARAKLHVIKGPLVGRELPLIRARSLVGGKGAHLELDEDLPTSALAIRVVRGRAMLQPATTPVFLGGSRVREIIPVFEGEEVRIGEHVFTIETETVEESPSHRDTFGEMVGRSEVMGRMFGVLQRIATHDAPVLLTGESGTGKELTARGVHGAGPRHDGPFVAVNCAAIAETLVESELFGHEKGAFTGATQRQDGAFHRAHEGTLFLDEIGEMKLDVQAKLLRALESGEVRRVGGQKPEFPDVRVVAATNRNLRQMVAEGTFREDLYYRLAVLTAHLPPLRERPEDIAVLAKTLVSRHHPGARLTPDALSALEKYNWPGNVRELRNVLTRAVVMGGNVVHAGNLEFNPWSFESSTTTASSRAMSSSDEGPSVDAILKALKRHNGNKAKTARDLGIPRSTLLYRLKKLGLT